jgi:lipopolysaccharide export system protein LptC
MDRPELDFSPPLGPARLSLPAPQAPWPWRVRQALAAYLPLLLMALLALGTWWLVKNTPLGEAEQPTAPPRHEPDYTMQRFTLQRFAPDGRLRVQIEGEQLRHFPDTDTLEIDTVRIRALAATGGVTRATAKQAISNGDGSEVQLLGGAQVTREADASSPAVEFSGEFLHAFLDAERLRSHLPVVVRQGTSVIHAAGFEFDNLTRAAKFQGPVRATFEPPTRRR